MAFYKNFETGDVIFDNATVTSGIFQDGASSIITFHSSSTQYTNTGDYNVKVSKALISEWNNTTLDLTYYIALEP